MPARTSRVTGALGAVALLSTLAACGGSSSAATPLSHTGSSAAAHPEWSKYTFTIGDNGGDGGQALSKITGAFANAPYKVKFARFTFGPPLVQAAASGDIDLGSVGDVPPITGAAKEYGFKIVAVERSLRPTRPIENIIVPKGSPIRTLADLKGKKLAVPQGSSAHGLALNALSSVGLTPKDVHLVFLDPAAGATAFAGGKVDAWAIWNPQSALAVQQGARILVKGLPPIDQTSSYYVASDTSLKDPVKRAALTDVLKRLAAQFHWAVQHPAQYAQAISQEEGIPLSDAKTVLPTMESRVTPVGKADIAAEQQLGNAFLTAHQISRKVDVPAITDNLLPAGFDSSKPN
ncbi:aliphatic sulfonate ABC transporter substrate-binding protein [Streptomyces sp. SL13]|jgi:sulfonate transport system substrate-binding protein|uniref:Putative aliphatic sulfonates-binding protein n=1 Tax=Streptantibioticus silvisoli TaxID=2705255 RepID=A0AA90GTY9_9ACTN|nr:aliphatic sulfonate ABC transporter substrate-binding protein [Streptantibioticus silvisoli]MDI5962372.1 aliphatic sulfonate ABC transporter substrate-binding protein [Streptantibioticus silvisoli]MDI5967884.1 aliphatic sulfonate ABC transporter substrate-binding protein [Streptantibioticus silvisoli]